MTKPTGKRKSPTKREIEIGGRLKEAREYLRLSQSQFAEGIGIKRVRLASYETGRYPLRWEVALRCCRRFQISEDWLATGGVKKKGWPRDPYRFGPGCRAAMFKASDPILDTLPIEGIFSEVYDGVLSKDYWAMLGKSALTWTRVDISEIKSADELATKMEADLSQWTKLLPEDACKRFCEGILKAGAVLFVGLNEGNPPTPSEQFPQRFVPPLRIEKVIEAEMKRLQVTEGTEQRKTSKKIAESN